VASRLPASIDVKKELSHVIRAVSLIKEELKGKVPLIGFSAAPWTLMYYMVGGSSKKNKEVASTWLKTNPVESQKLLDLLTTVVIDYMSAQVEAGADMIQVFEAMGEFISEEDFYRFVLLFPAFRKVLFLARPHPTLSLSLSLSFSFFLSSHRWALPTLQRICSELRKRHPITPLLVFPRGAPYALAKLQQAGFDVVSMDTKTDRVKARELLAAAAKKELPPHGRVSGLQGNFDVALLQEGAATTDQVRAATEAILKELGPQALIANLGEGLTGKEDPALVAAFIDAVHDTSRKLIKG